MAMLACNKAVSRPLAQPARRNRLQPACALPSTQPSSQQQKPFAGILAAGVAAWLLAQAPVAQAEEMRTLADVMRPSFSFVDANKDGIVSQAELDSLAQEVAQEQDFDAPRDELLAFTVRVFDLNQDGKLTTDELLTGLAMDNAVSGNTLDETVFKVFDKDGNGTIDMAEWKAPFGSLGRYGEELKEYTFNRVEYLSDSDNKLDVPELANALTLMRVQVLGY